MRLCGRKGGIIAHFRELYVYRILIQSLVIKDLKARYARSRDEHRALLKKEFPNSAFLPK